MCKDIRLTETITGVATTPVTEVIMEEAIMVEGITAAITEGKHLLIITLCMMLMSLMDVVQQASSPSPPPRFLLRDFLEQRSTSRPLTGLSNILFL